MNQTIRYSDKSEGWISFDTYQADIFCKLNNRFFSIKNGQLYLHNDENNPIRNNFYGSQIPTKVSTVINDENSEDKIFKTLVLESNKSFDATITTNYTNSSINNSEFNNRESRWFSHIRKNEDINDLHGDVIQGIGIIQSSVGNTISFGNVSESVSVGDKLYQLNNGSNQEIGTITNISNGVITVGSTLISPINGLFCFSKKNSRVEGTEIRGYYALVDLENNDTSAVEIFAIESNIIKSYV